MAAIAEDPVLAEVFRQTLPHSTYHVRLKELEAHKGELAKVWYDSVCAFVVIGEPYLEERVENKKFVDEHGIDLREPLHEYSLPVVNYFTLEDKGCVIQEGPLQITATRGGAIPTPHFFYGDDLERYYWIPGFEEALKKIGAQLPDNFEQKKAASLASARNGHLEALVSWDFNHTGWRGSSEGLIQQAVRLGLHEVEDVVTIRPGIEVNIAQYVKELAEREKVPIP
ncbi:hypothetical protein ACFL2V_15035 [Pseudomonadota bacterium]